MESHDPECSADVGSWGLARPVHANEIQNRETDTCLPFDGPYRLAMSVLPENDGFLLTSPKLGPSTFGLPNFGRKIMLATCHKLVFRSLDRGFRTDSATQPRDEARPGKDWDTLK